MNTYSELKRKSVYFTKVLLMVVTEKVELGFIFGEYDLSMYKITIKTELFHNNFISTFTFYLGNTHLYFI